MGIPLDTHFFCPKNMSESANKHCPYLWYGELSVESDVGITLKGKYTHFLTQCSRCLKTRQHSPIEDVDYEMQL